MGICMRGTDLCPGNVSPQQIKACPGKEEIGHLIQRKIITPFLIIPGQTQVKFTDYNLAHAVLPSLSQRGSSRCPFAAVALSPLLSPIHFVSQGAD